MGSLGAVRVKLLTRKFELGLAVATEKISAKVAGCALNKEVSNRPVNVSDTVKFGPAVAVASISVFVKLVILT